MSQTEDSKEKNLPSRLSTQPKPTVSAEDLMPDTGLPQTSPSSETSDPKLRNEPAYLDTSAHKFELEPPNLASRKENSVPEYENLGELPSSYGTQKLYLTARNPFWLFVYWDLSFDEIAEAERNAHDNKVFIQVYLADGNRVQQIQITPWSREWMIHINRPNTTFYAELGYYRYDGGFEVVSRSANITTPRDNLSENTDVRFVTIPFDYSFKALLELIRDLALDGEGLADTLARLQEAGHPLPFDHHGGRKLTDEERARLLEMLGEDIVRRRWIDSQEIIERITNRFQLASTQSSGQWPPSSHWLGSSWSGGLGQRGFSMHVNAELIIYGGTEPGSSMRVDGKDIELDENGNFYFHFNFNEGKYHIPIEATSADGNESASALLSFLRMTESQGNVRATPQPPRDQPMGQI
ncbi:MAG: DUF4912 domain-containing protein [Verrucomicrobiota bacterium]